MMNKNRKLNKKILVNFIVLCIASATVIYILNLVNHNYTNKDRAIKSVFSSYSDNLLKKAQANGLTLSLNQIQDFNDVKVELKDVYFDRTNLIIGILVTGADSLEPIHFIPYYNQRKIGNTNLGGITPISKNEYMRCINIPIIENKLPLKFNITLIGTDSIGKDKKFKFEIPVDFAKVDRVSKLFDLNKTSKSDIALIKVKSITFTPLSTVIDYECKYNGEMNYTTSLKENDKYKVDGMVTYSSKIKDCKTEYSKVFFKPLREIPDDLVFKITCKDKNKQNETITIMKIKLK